MIDTGSIMPEPTASGNLGSLTRSSYQDQFDQTNRRPVVIPPYSSRTLAHPSFLSLYVAVGSIQYRRQPSSQRGSFPVPAMIPSDFFYTDPALAPGTRVTNCVTRLEVFECCQLNTPPPIMSVRQAPPPVPDPFRTRSHPTRDLGSELWTWDRFYNGRAGRDRASQERTVEIIQMSEEEDQAITSLLKLRYHASHNVPRRGTADGGSPWTQAQSSPSNSEPGPGGAVPPVSLLGSQARQRSEVELEAANILLTLEDMGAIPKEAEPLNTTPKETEPLNITHKGAEPQSPTSKEVESLNPTQGDPGNQSAENLDCSLPAESGVLTSIGRNPIGTDQMEVSCRQDGLDAHWPREGTQTPCTGQHVFFGERDTGQVGVQGARSFSKAGRSDLEGTAAYALLDLSQQKVGLLVSQGT